MLHNPVSRPQLEASRQTRVWVIVKPCGASFTSAIVVWLVNIGPPGITVLADVQWGTSETALLFTTSLDEIDRTREDDPMP